MSPIKFAPVAVLLALSSLGANCQTQSPVHAAAQDPTLNIPASNVAPNVYSSNLFAIPSYKPSNTAPGLFIAHSPDPKIPGLNESLPSGEPFEFPLHSRRSTNASNPDFNDQPDDPKPKSKTSKNKDKLKVHPFSTFALGIRAGTLGAGAEIATPLSRSLNLRASANYMSFRYSFRIDGINYYTRADFRSGQLGVDWFPFHGGFHISPGFMYFQTGLSGAAKVPPGQSFTLDKTTYINSVDDPVSGNASVVYGRHYAPVVTFGFTNIIPRNGKHFSMPFEIGVAYTHAPVMDVQLAGTACTNQGCFNAGTDPDTQANLKQEVNDINDTVKQVVVYPIATLGIAVRF